MSNKRQLIRLAACGFTLATMTNFGCASRGGVLGVDCCADVPAGAIPEAAGAKVCAWQISQVTSAIADQTVLYQADFIGKTEVLSPGAVERMARNANSGLAKRPAFIEPSGDTSLDAARVNSVSIQLASLGIGSPIVELATPAALGLRGPQAERVARISGSFGNSSSSRTGAPTSQASGIGGQTGSFGGSLPGGIF